MKTAILGAILLALTVIFQEELKETWFNYGLTFVPYKEKREYLIDKELHKSWTIHEDFYSKIPWDVDIILRNIELKEDAQHRVDILPSVFHSFTVVLDNLTENVENSHAYELDIRTIWQEYSEDGLNQSYSSITKSVVVENGTLLEPYICQDSAVYIYIDKIIPNGILATIAHKKLTVIKDKMFKFSTNRLNCIQLPVEEINDTPVLVKPDI